MSVELIIDGPIAKVVLNRPEKLNALTWEMRMQLCDYFEQIRYNDDIRAVIVTGAGTSFCSPADIDRMGDSDIRAAPLPVDRATRTYTRQLHAIGRPVIAAVGGNAVGVGWSIALACDIVVAS